MLITKRNAIHCESAEENFKYRTVSFVKLKVFFKNKPPFKSHIYIYAHILVKYYFI